MNAQKKTYVIDTNVLLHDPNALSTFTGHDVVIPLAVLEELDSMKRYRDEMGKSVRAVLRFFDSLKDIAEGDVHSGATLPDGTTIRVQLEIKTESKADFSLSLTSSKYRILMAACFLKDKGESVVFVSKDLTMRVKAKAVGLEVQDYENQKFSYESIYKGYRNLDLSKHDIDLFSKDGKLPLSESDLQPNEYCLLNCEEKSSAVGKFDAESGGLISLLPINGDVWGIKPLNVEQRCALDLLLRDEVKLVTLVGPAGTGKTLLALAVGLRKVFDEGTYSRILVSRPIMPLGKDIGFLPGYKEEKLIHWMQPIYDNLEFLCSSCKESDETLRWVTESKKLEMEAVTYIRGRSLPKIYVIIDEAQNLTPHEVKTIISRAGEDTKVVLTGDPTQIDNPYLDKDSNGLNYIVGCFKERELFGHVFMDKTERSKLAALAAEVM